MNCKIKYPERVSPNISIIATFIRFNYNYKKFLEVKYFGTGKLKCQIENPFQKQPEQI